MFKSINMAIYFVCTWLFSLYLCASFLQNVPNGTPLDALHTALILTTYAAMYQGPAIVGYWLLKRWTTLAVLTGLFLSVLGHIFVFADSRLYDLYGFHINGFIWNLVTSKGGIESLGADQTNLALVFGYVAIIVAVHVLALFLAIRFHTIRIPVGTVLVLFLLATTAERGIYGYHQATLYAPVLERGSAFPLYQPLTMHSLLKRLGVDVKKSSKVKFKQAKGALQYPKHPLDVKKQGDVPNIVILAVESLRWDMLNKTTMPYMNAFAAEAWNFTNHYSGGNGTRQGLFALFYGLHGNYWDPFLLQRQGPALFDVLNRYNYQYFIYTSAKFTYPEFDQTIFVDVPKQNLHENSEGEPWKRDIKSSRELIDAIARRDSKRPFFAFLFYEGTHARYSFDPGYVVPDNYLKSLDYTGMSRKDLLPQIDGMKARYDNAAYGVDRELHQVVAALKKSGDIANTIIIITGDHGEEFMERGRWGHNSSFSDWQVRVPMIVSMPGQEPGTITRRTSHMDVIPTLFPLLGVQNPVRDYSLGVSLATPEEKRNVVVASWSDIGLINDYGKLVIPFKSTTQHLNLATDLDDHPVDGATLTAKMKPIIFRALADARYYMK